MLSFLDFTSFFSIFLDCFQFLLHGCNFLLKHDFILLDILVLVNFELFLLLFTQSYKIFDLFLIVLDDGVFCLHSILQLVHSTFAQNCTYPCDLRRFPSLSGFGRSLCTCRSACRRSITLCGCFQATWFAWESSVRRANDHPLSFAFIFFWSTHHFAVWESQSTLYWSASIF